MEEPFTKCRTDRYERVPIAMTKILAIVLAPATFTLAIALASPALAGSVSDAFWNSYGAATLGGLQGSGAFDRSVRIGCGAMGLGSTGECREGILGAIDQSAHGACRVDPRTMATRCER